MGRKINVSLISSRMGRDNLSVNQTSTHMLSLREKFKQSLNEDRKIHRFTLLPYF